MIDINLEQLVIETADLIQRAAIGPLIGTNPLTLLDAIEAGQPVAVSLLRSTWDELAGNLQPDQVVERANYWSGDPAPDGDEARTVQRAFVLRKVMDATKPVLPNVGDPGLIALAMLITSYTESAYLSDNSLSDARASLVQALSSI
jgi:hypothetical protein